MAVRAIRLRAIFLVGAMLLAAGVTKGLLTPTVRMADLSPKFVLEDVIPTQFSNWRVDTSQRPLIIAADVQSKLDELYSQTLTRTYANDRGDRIMLSIAYGADQSGDATQVHRPEFCYTAQGFQLMSSSLDAIRSRFGAFEVKRLVAVKGARYEPITYWITVGNRATLPGLQRKLSQLSYGLTGKIPDGLLFRVSSIDRSNTAYEIHNRFVLDLIAALTETDRARLIGVPDA